MKERKDCKIVQDLLPNYIEKLTNEETNNYIEEHLKQCDECKEILENMQKDLNLNTEKRDAREVKYIKKFSYKLNILKFILLAIFLVFIIVTGRKMIIISDLSSKAEKLMSSTNYYYSSSSFDKDSYFKLEYYNLGNKQKLVNTTFGTNQDWERQTIVATKAGIDEDKNDIYNLALYSEKVNRKEAMLVDEGSNIVNNRIYKKCFFY